MKLAVGDILNAFPLNYKMVGPLRVSSYFILGCLIQYFDIFCLNHFNHAKAMSWCWSHHLVSLAFYLAASAKNGNLSEGHFQRSGEVGPTLNFCRKLSQEMLENTMGM